MPEERDAEEVAGVTKALGDGKVGPRRGRVAGRMVVCDDDGGGVVSYGGFEDLSRMDKALVEGTDRDGLATDFLAPAVEEEHDAMFLPAPADVLHPLPHVLRRKQECGPLVLKEPLAEFEARDDFAGLCRAESLDRLQFRDGRFPDSVFLESSEDLFRKRHDIRPLESGPQENRQKFLILEFLRPVLLHPFAGPFDVRNILHPCHIVSVRFEP